MRSFLLILLPFALSFNPFHTIPFIGPRIQHRILIKNQSALSERLIDLTRRLEVCTGELLEAKDREKRRREEGAVGYVRRFRRTEQENEEAAKEMKKEVDRRMEIEKEVESLKEEILSLTLERDKLTLERDALSARLSSEISKGEKLASERDQAVAQVEAVKRDALKAAEREMTKAKAEMLTEVKKVSNLAKKSAKEEVKNIKGLARQDMKDGIRREKEKGAKKLKEVEEELRIEREKLRRIVRKSVETRVGEMEQRNRNRTKGGKGIAGGSGRQEKEVLTTVGLRK